MVYFKGYCSKGYGCLCHQGFTGINCEIPQSSLETKRTYPNEIINFYATSKNKLSSKPTINTHQPSEPTRKIVTKYLRSSPPPSTTNKLELECKNGGFLIDNMCLCINSYSGATCEISPVTTVTAKLQTVSEDIVYLNLIDDTKTHKSELKKAQPEVIDSQIKPKQAQDHDFTYLTFNRVGRTGMN